MGKRKKKYKFRQQHSNSTGESAKEQRAKRMIYHDLRTTMLFVFEALICLIIYSTLVCILNSEQAKFLINWQEVCFSSTWG